MFATIIKAAKKANNWIRISFPPYAGDCTQAGFAQKVLFCRDFLCRLASYTRIYSNTQLKCSLDNYLEMVAD